jgi:hypothetical protein
VLCLVELRGFNPDPLHAIHGMPSRTLLLLSIRAGQGQITTSRLEPLLSPGVPSFMPQTCPRHAERPLGYESFSRRSQQYAPSRNAGRSPAGSPLPHWAPFRPISSASEKSREQPREHEEVGIRTRRLGTSSAVLLAAKAFRAGVCSYR